jgi:selenocysteine-specific elongation factor
MERPGAGTAQQLDQAVAGGADERATALLAVHGSIDAGLVDAATGGGRPAGAVVAGGRYISEQAAADQVERAVALVDAFHADHPLRPGMPASALASQLGMDRRQLASLIEQSGERFVDDGATVRVAGFEHKLTAEEEGEWASARSQLAGSLAVPRAGQLGLTDELLHAVVRRGDLVLVDDDLVYLPEQIDMIDRHLDGIVEPFTVSAFRDALGLSRRHAVPLLEWLDRSGRTIRDGDLRKVR